MQYTNQEHWNREWKNWEYSIANPNDPIVKLMNQYIPNAKTGEECYEIGCVPCGYLAYVGAKKAYIINGIDYSDGLNKRLFKWLQRQQLAIGEIKKADFFKENSSKQYEFVYSLGFIEHFKDYEKVIDMHDRYVKMGGYLLITTPNYRGKFNYCWNKIFNPVAMKRHNLNSMQPKVWASILEKKGYQVIWNGYFGGFSLWNDDPKESRNLMKNFIMNIVCNMVKQKPNVKSSEKYSPYCGIVAKK